MVKERHLMAQHYFGMPPQFDPSEGVTVVEPEGEGYGYWVGGHNVVYDPDEHKFYLYYRIRHPLGKGRGGKCCVAESSDGVQFRCIWEATKEQLHAQSIEAGSLIQDPETGRWRLYVSYQVLGGTAWRVDVLEANKPAEFDAWHHRTVMDPQDYGVSFIKDPKVYIVGGLYTVFACVSPQRRWEENEAGWRHPLGMDSTAILTSPDGLYFGNFKYVFESGSGPQGEWGHFRARINSVIYLPPVYIGFFDGGTTSYDNYGEWCGIATSHDLERWTRVSTDRPWIRSAHGCIRYMDALVVEDAVWYYYEWTREDGSHELRMNKVGL